MTQGPQRIANPHADQRLRPMDLSALISLTVLSSFTPIAVACAVATIPPIIGGVLRFTMAAIFIGAVLVLRRKLQLPQRADWLLIVTLGVVCVPINQMAFWGGVELANASHAAMLYSTTPVLVAVMACLMRMERWSFPVMGGAVLAVLGVLVILLDSGLFLKRSFIRGDLLLLVAVATWSGYLVFSRRLNIRYGSLASQFWIFLSGAIISLPLLAFRSAQMNWANVTILSWLGLIYLTLFVAVGVFFLYNWCIERQPPSRVATFGNAAFPLTLIWEALLHGRLPGIWFLAGSVLLLSGMMLTIYGPRRYNALGTQPPMPHAPSTEPPSTDTPSPGPPMPTPIPGPPVPAPMPGTPVSATPGPNRTF